MVHDRYYYIIYIGSNNEFIWIFIYCLWWFALWAPYTSFYNDYLNTAFSFKLYNIDVLHPICE